MKAPVRETAQMHWTTRVRALAHRMSLFVLFGLAACGGGGGGSTSSTSSGNPSLTPASKLFVADSGTFSIASTANANPSPGTLTVDRVIYGPQTGVANNAGHLTIDAANDRLYVANGTSILVFNGAGTASGNVAPTRTITSTRFGNVSSLFLDTAHDVLYAGDDLNGVWVINNASGANGLISPDRTITGNFTGTGGGTFQIHGIVADTARDILYVSLTTFAQGGAQRILAFNGASTLNGSTLVPDRTISPAVVYAGRILFDQGHDRLYMSDVGAYCVYVFESISTTNGSSGPNRAVSFPAAIEDIAVDLTHDRLYALNPGALYIVNGLSTASGAVAATAIYAPTGSILNAVGVTP
jgi:hypothetical protein